MPRRAPIAKPPRFQSSNRDRERERRSGGIRRLYDSAQWRQRTQPFVLERDPMCQLATTCGGNAPSTEAHHKIKATSYVAQHGGDYRKFFDTSNLQGACKACHSAETARGG